MKNFGKRNCFLLFFCIYMYFCHKLHNKHYLSALTLCCQYFLILHGAFCEIFTVLCTARSWYGTVVHMFYSQMYQFLGGKWEFASLYCLIYPVQASGKMRCPTWKEKKCNDLSSVLYEDSAWSLVSFYWKSSSVCSFLSVIALLIYEI